MNLSFFGKPLFIQRHTGHILRGSTSIRAEQVAEYLGAKFNPTKGYENDVCIYIKPHESQNFAKNSYIDIVDGITSVRWLKERPELKVIAYSQTSYEYLSSNLPKNKIILIPQQNCNFERIRRDRKKIDTVGIIGLSSSFMYPFDEIEKRLAEIGMKLFTGFDYRNRKDIVNLYKQIDIQITWRTANLKLKSPLKIYNAASFGIPTVGYEENSNKEFDGYYIPVHTIDELIKEVSKFKDQSYYDEFAEKIMIKAEDYNISKIAELYKHLKGVKAPDGMNTLKYILDGYKIGDSKSPIRLWCSREITFPRLIRRLNFTLGAEIGVARGIFSRVICQQNPNLKLYAVDAWKTYAGYSYLPEQQKMDNLYEDAKKRLSPYNCQVIRDWSIGAVKKFADESLDFVYIDANHDYEHAKEDIREWSKKVRKGGIVAGHDYCNGLRPESGDNQTEYGVKKAVDEWVKQKKIKYIFILAKDNAQTWFYIK